MIHRVPPGYARQKAEMRAPERRNAALGLHLAEARILGGDHDVAGEHQLDADREHDALQSRDNRLAAALGKAELTDFAFPDIALLRSRSEEFRHVQTGGDNSNSSANAADTI